MPTIVSTIDIAAPAGAIFDYGTTPANWPKFWPVTLGVSGDVDRPAEIGAKWIEQVKISLWRGEFHWTATARERPGSFVMEGTSYGHGFLGRLTPSAPGRIAYTLTATGTGTHFRREMTYGEPTLFLRLIGTLFMQRAMSQAIDQALHNLKRIMESPDGGHGS